LDDNVELLLRGGEELLAGRSLLVSRKPLELRAESKFGSALARLGKAQQAGELLAPAFEWFTERFDARDLKEAKALPEGLAA
jgi:hypothetical protein